ncbi:malonyl CoA-acyl carrier protein transacylase [Ascobolus immersus RN42]|uniref:[acyl-carrier-protein] S-malonyltransferase n=1 Tax=Ascobolus immersus RN42 TaxID=1160509 RepID=A0A3N4HLR7_ASCIM|nr:malonyl CoA-acyl carrier protein transacylase [Ascobolus immersus RN42]
MRGSLLHKVLRPPRPQSIHCQSRKFHSSSRRRTKVDAHPPSESKPKSALVFPGQGTQKVGMLNDLQKNFPRTVNPILEAVDATIASIDPSPYSQMSRSLTEIIREGPSRLLTETENAQPAIVTTSICILKVLQQDFGYDVSSKVDYHLGHSLGEFAALVSSGALSFRDTIKIVRQRGEIMASASRSHGEEGELGMVALITPAKRLPELIANIEELLHRGDPDEIFGCGDRCVHIANINSSTQIVLSGHIQGIQHLLKHLRKWSGQDPRAIRLNVSAPFHSMIMAPSIRVVSDALAKCDLNFPELCTVLSNVTARPYQSAEEIRQVLPKQVVETVRWYDSIKYLDEEQNVRRWINIGPGVKVGRNLIGKEVKGGMESVVSIGEDMDGKAFEEVVKKLEDWP